MSGLASKSADNSELKKKSRILYVDGDVDSRLVLSFLLALSHYQVETASTAAEGLQLAERNGFTLIILANYFGDGSGAELCRNIRSFDLRTPILFFSSAPCKADIQQAMSAGAQGYLTKPCGIQDLEQAIMRLTQADSQCV